MTWWHVLQHWLAVHTGTENESSHYYAWWSGAGSDVGEVALIAAVVTAFRHINCHSPYCPRRAKFKLVDGTYKVCWHHLPEDMKLLHPRRPSLAHIHALHAAHVERTQLSDSRKEP